MISKSVKHKTNSRMIPKNKMSDYDITEHEVFHVNFVRTEARRKLAIQSIQRILNHHASSHGAGAGAGTGPGSRGDLQGGGQPGPPGRGAGGHGADIMIHFTLCTLFNPQYYLYILFGGQSAVYLPMNSHNNKDDN